MSQAQLQDSLFSFLHGIRARVEALERFATQVVHKNRPQLVGVFDSGNASSAMTPVIGAGSFSPVGSFRLIGPMPKRSDSGGGLKRRLRLVTTGIYSGAAGTLSATLTFRLAGSFTAVTSTQALEPAAGTFLYFLDTGYIDMDSAIGDGDVAVDYIEYRLSYTGTAPTATHHQSLVFLDYD